LYQIALYDERLRILALKVLSAHLTSPDAKSLQAVLFGGIKDTVGSDDLAAAAVIG